MPQRWNCAAQALPWPWHFSLQDLLSTCTEGIICVNSDFMIWFPHVVPMLRYLYCKGPSLLPPYPCTREPPYFLCTAARTSVLTYSATQATSSLKASFFFFVFHFTFQANELYGSWKRKSELRDVECNVEKSFLIFLFSSGSERDNNKCLSASQMEITSSTI